MKLFLAVVLGVLASFGLTILAELIWSNSTTKSVWRLHPEIPCVALIVGATLGLTARKQARIAAALGLAPWSMWLVVAVNAGHSTVSRWVTTIALVAVYFVLGGAAALVGRRMTRSVIRGGHESW